MDSSKWDDDQRYLDMNVETFDYLLHDNIINECNFFVIDLVFFLFEDTCSIIGDNLPDRIPNNHHLNERPLLK